MEWNIFIHFMINITGPCYMYRLVIELKQSLVPTAKSSNLFKQLSELCENISPPTGCIITPQYFSELDEEPSALTDVDGESSSQQECDAPTIELSDVNELKQTSR